MVKSVKGASKAVGVKAKQHFFKSLDLNTLLVPSEDKDGSFTATKLVCSLGPSSHSVPVLEAMLNGGMVAARIDLTWGGLDFHFKTLQALNTAMSNTRKLCAIILDTMGREVMVKRPCEIGEDGWPVHLDPFEVKAGATITITTRQDVEASSTVLPVTYPHLHNMVEEGDTLYIGRYLVCGADSASLYLHVVSVDDKDIVCTAQNDAVMDGLMTVFHMERSSDSLSNLQNNQPLLSDYDKHAIAALGAEFEVDFINLAYTRTREDVREARQFLDSVGLTNCKVLAKVETRQALLNLRGILALADGIVLSRGNIGLDIAPEKMALVQKQLISNCNLMGKPVLITRVVDSMVTNPRPTRAEATDIANAVLDGVDGILLGAETLRGEYPVEVVSTIAQICRVAEGVFDYSTHYDSLMDAAQEMDMVMRAAAQAAALAAGPHQVAHMNGGVGKNVAFAPGTCPGEPDGLDEASEPGSPSGSLSTDGHIMESIGGSYGNLQSAIEGYQELHAFAKFGGAGAHSVASMPHKGSTGSMAYTSSVGNVERLPFLSKLESLASSAVRSAGNTGADLIVVYTATGRTAQLVAKYRPPMPILTLVVPRLINDGIRWRLEGRSTARSCQLTRGLLPMLATPGPNGDAVLEAAVVAAARAGLVAPRHHVVVLQQVHEDFCVKVMSLNASGTAVVGSNVKLTGRTAAAGPISSCFQRSIAVRSSSTGALINSDDCEDDWSDDEEEDKDTTVLLEHPGSFGTSASMMYNKKAVEVMRDAVKHKVDVSARKTAPTDIPPRGSGTLKPNSPDTPMKLGSADQQKRVTLVDA